MTIQRALGLLTAPDNSLGWIRLLRAGLPSSAGETLQLRMGLSPAEFKALLVTNEGRLTEVDGCGVFNALESDVLYRAARAFRQACNSLSDEATAMKWFREPQPLLKKQIPLELLSSTLGSELVVVCLERLKPTKCEPVQAEAPDYTEDVVQALTL